jgi:hypothetical protein
MFSLKDNDVTAKKLYRINLLCVERLLDLLPADEEILRAQGECTRASFQPYIEKVQDPTF